MQSTSTEFRDHLKACDYNLHLRLEIKTANDETLTITESDIASGTCKITDGTTESGTFDFGGAIIPKFEVSIAKSGYEDIDFTSARLLLKYRISVKKSTSITYYPLYKKMTFYLDEPEENGGNTIKLTGNGAISKLDTNFDPTEFNALSAPTWQDMIDCILSGSSLSASNTEYIKKAEAFNAEKIRDNIFAGEKIYTRRELIQYIAQVAGYYARTDRNGALCFSTYDKAAFDDLDMNDINSIDESAYHVFTKDRLFAFAPWKNELTIEGIWNYNKTKNRLSCNGAGSKETDAYVLLHTSDNPLVPYASGVTNVIAWYDNTEGLSFTPMTLTAPCDPTVEVGDPLVVIGKDNKIYKAYVTNMSMTFGGAMQLTCDAEKPERHKEKNLTELSEDS